MKTCSKCHLEKDEFCFQKDKGTSDGYHPSCKECRKSAKRISYLKHKTEIISKQRQKRQAIQEWINQYKTKCAYCDEKHPACLDFHHTGDKDASIADLANRKTLSKQQKSAILAEMQKCIVLCSNCHRKLHWNEREARSSNWTRTPDFQSG